MTGAKLCSQTKGDEVLRQCVLAAVADLEAHGWAILRRRSGSGDAWHIVSMKGARLRVIQIVPPATPAARRQQGRALLGERTHVPASLGTMEQWLAHLCPDGRVIFRPYVLHPRHWVHRSALKTLGLAA
jgi:hypothetical protein